MRRRFTDNVPAAEEPSVACCPLHCPAAQSVPESAADVHRVASAVPPNALYQGAKAKDKHSASLLPTVELLFHALRLAGAPCMQSAESEFRHLDGPATVMIWLALLRRDGNLSGKVIANWRKTYKRRLTPRPKCFTPFNVFVELARSFPGCPNNICVVTRRHASPCVREERTSFISIGADRRPMPPPPAAAAPVLAPVASGSSPAAGAALSASSASTLARLHQLLDGAQRSKEEVEELSQRCAKSHGTNVAEALAVALGPTRAAGCGCLLGTVAAADLPSVLVLRFERSPQPADVDGTLLMLEPVNGVFYQLVGLLVEGPPGAESAYPVAAPRCFVRLDGAWHLYDANARGLRGQLVRSGLFWRADKGYGATFLVYAKISVAPGGASSVRPSAEVLAELAKHASQPPAPAPASIAGDGPSAAPSAPTSSTPAPLLATPTSLPESASMSQSAGVHAAGPRPTLAPDIEAEYALLQRQKVILERKIVALHAEANPTAAQLAEMERQSAAYRELLVDLEKLRVQLNVPK